MTAYARKMALLAAREDFGIEDSLHALDGMSVALQRRFGFEPIPLDSLGAGVLEQDPGIDAQLAERLLTLVDRRRVDEILTEEDLRRRSEQFAYIAQTTLGPVKRWYGSQEKPAAFAERLRSEHESYRRISVVLETDPAETVGVGNFQILGAGQQVREFLWALSGVLPRDTGEPISEHFRRYVNLFDD